MLIFLFEAFGTGFPLLVVFCQINPVWPDWAKFRQLGYFLKSLANFLTKKIAQLLGYFLGEIFAAIFLLKIVIFEAYYNTNL